MPAIDPLSSKNRELPRYLARQTVAELGIDLHRPLLLQVSRFDPWKDPLGVVDVWRRVREEVPSLQLALVGFMAGDDPEGWRVHQELERATALEEDCFLLTNQMGVAAHEVNALQRVADVARRMHESGMNHRDFYICHFLLHLDPAPTPAALRLSLIDLHRAQIRARTPRRWRDKDLASLYFSALDIGLTQRDKLRFLRGYFGRPLREILRDEAALLARLDARAAQLQTRYLRKYAPAEERR